MGTDEAGDTSTLGRVQAALVRFSKVPTVDSYIEEAEGRTPLPQVAPLTGGPAGNARLTATLGLIVLVGFLGQLLTLIDVKAVVAWHIAIGSGLIVVVVAKVVTTSYKIVRYYTGNPMYRREGPPPIVLRILGPILVLAGLVALATGLALVLMGSQAGTAPLISGFGRPLTFISIHNGAVWVWGVALAIHVLGRLVPMILRLRVPFGAIPGTVWRVGFLILVVIGVVAAVTWALGHVGGWPDAPRPH